MDRKHLEAQVEDLKNVIVWLLLGIDWIAGEECDDPRTTAREMLDAVPKYDAGQHQLGCGPITLDEKAWMKPQVKQGEFPWMARQPDEGTTVGRES